MSLPGQSASELSGAAPRTNAPSQPVVSLPDTDDIDKVVARIEAKLEQVRLRAAAPRTSDSAAATSLGATPEELGEREQLLQQWVIALDQHAAYLRSLKELRRLNRERDAEQEAWRGFAETPTLVTGEQLTDAVSAQQLETRTARMLLSIFENETTRFATRLKEDHKQLRLAQDQTAQTDPQSPRQQWLVQLAELRKEADAAAVETGETGRLFTWESLNGRQRHLAFLERKLSTARAQARIRDTDLEVVLTQIGEKRAALQRELKEVITVDREARAARDAARERLRPVQSDTTTTGPGRSAQIAEHQAAAEAAQARVETTGQKLEMLRGFLQLTDYVQTIWHDRSWATQPRTVSQLRSKQRHYGQALEGLRQWKTLMEQALSAVSDQMLRQSLRTRDPRLTGTDRDLASQVQSTLQERAAVLLRAVGALAMTEDLTDRLNTELSEQVTRISVTGKFHSVLEEVGAVCRRIWSTELYIAEDSVIAGGQKVSIPRSITLGKVVIALTIFLVGLVVARCAHRLACRFGARGRQAAPQGAHLPATALAVAVASVALLVAMASVRIPWTAFAFMGGALAIGVGFGAQTLINNFISGVILLGERGIRIGDIVEVDNQKGKVMRMGFRHSLIARGDGSEVLVPNSQFLEKKVVNWTLTNDRVRHAVSVGVGYGAAPDQVIRLIAQAAAEHPQVVQDPAPEALLEDFGESALRFSLQFWLELSPAVDGGRVRSELRQRISALFHEAGIVMASPQREVHLDAVRPLEIKLVSPATARSIPMPHANGKTSSPHTGRVRV